MTARLYSLFLSLHAKFGTVPLIGLAVIGLYTLYVIKMHLGIDIFPNWGLHLLGPRSFIRVMINDWKQFRGE
jgi:hypothetical protein